MVYGGAFRHSDPQTMGRSGENIVFRGPYKDSPDGWRQAAEKLFEDWRNSPSHNANMLSAGFQGMGLGLVRTADGEVWGTTMFFTGEIPVRVGSLGNAYLRPDRITERAEASGVPFYVPAGARGILGVAPLSNPTDTKGYNITYTVKVDGGQEAEVIPELTVREQSGTRTYTLDKSKNAPRALDPAVTGTSITAVPTTEKTPAPSSTTTSKSTQVPPTTPKPPAPSTSVKPPAPSSTTTRSAQVPTAKTSPTTSTASNAPSPSGGGSSTAGFVIGVLLALIAAVGAAVVAMPMVTGR